MIPTTEPNAAEAFEQALAAPSGNVTNEQRRMEYRAEARFSGAALGRHFDGLVAKAKLTPAQARTALGLAVGRAERMGLAGEAKVRAVIERCIDLATYEPILPEYPQIVSTFSAAILASSDGPTSADHVDHTALVLLAVGAAQCFEREAEKLDHGERRIALEHASQALVVRNFTANSGPDIEALVKGAVRVAPFVALAMGTPACEPGSAA